MEYEIYKVDDELTHWGIKGMKWGIRRYQNKDGSLTKAGKRRYDAELEKVRKEEKILKNRQATRAKMERLEARKKAAADAKAELDEAEGKTEKRKWFSRKQKETVVPNKTVKDMSDVELYEAINRARMEDTYRNLRPDKVEKPKAFQQLVNDVVKPAATNAGKQFLENALKQAGAKLLEGKVDPDSLQALTLMRDKLKMKNEIKKLEKDDPDSIEEMTKTRDKLKLKNEIENLKKGPSEPEKSAKDKLTEIQYEKAKRELDSLKAQDAAKEAENAAKNAAKEAERKKAYRTMMTVSNRANKTIKPLIPRSELQMYGEKTKQQASEGKAFVSANGDTLFTTSAAAQERGKAFVSANGDTLFTWGDD